MFRYRDGRKIKLKDLKEEMALASFFLGLPALCSVFVLVDLPLCTFAMTLPALVLGYVGLDSERRTFAIIGLAMGGITALIIIGTVVMFWFAG